MSLAKLGNNIPFDFTTHDPKTGNVCDADSLPTAKVFEEADMIPMCSPTVVKRGSEIGLYIVKIDTTTAGGFELGKYYNVVVEATVGGITAKARIAQFRVESQSTSDITGHKIGQKMTYKLSRLRKGHSDQVLELIKTK